uniref:Uncharacterized protein n=1 Tax=Arundo donax TaxID=35708 RepID=A0A0A9A2Y2_ARUDO
MELDYFIKVTIRKHLIIMLLPNIEMSAKTCPHSISSKAPEKWSN